MSAYDFEDVESEENGDVLSSRDVHRAHPYLTLKYFSSIEDVPSLGIVNKDKKTDVGEEAGEGKTYEHGKFDPIQTSPTLQQIGFLKQRKRVQLGRKKMDPPPGFYRMKERKRQKELAKQQQQENASSPKNRRLKPNRRRRSSSETPELLEDIMNGAITETIPEDFSVCLESPSHYFRVQKFREMFEEETIATTVRRFLF